MKHKYRVRKEIRKFESGREEIWFIPEHRYRFLPFWRRYARTTFFGIEELCEYKTEYEAWNCINTVKDKTVI